MDETDLFGFSKSKKKKHDKADTAKGTASHASDSDDVARYEGSKKTIVSRPTRVHSYGSYPCAGIALIFNHKDVRGQYQRVGTEQDRDAMEATLLRYGFDVRVYDDLIFEKLIETLEAVAQEDHSRNDCFVLSVMTHGIKGKLYAKDMLYPVERLWNPFLGDKCKTLINKPKLFFIQACRGTNIERAVEYSRVATMSRSLETSDMELDEPEPETFAIPSTADMLVFYSTFESYYSFRNVENGSWFIQSLCQVLDAAAEEASAETQGVELLQLLTAVNRKVAYEFQSHSQKETFNQAKEMPNFLSTLTKMFYLRVKANKASK